MTAPDMTVDWFRVLCDLHQAGVGNREAARLLDVPKSTLLGWKQGAIPKHHEGERLIELWCVQLGRERLLLPYRAVERSAACWR